MYAKPIDSTGCVRLRNVEDLSIHAPSKTLTVGHLRMKADRASKHAAGSFAVVRLDNDIRALVGIGVWSRRSAWIELWAGEPGSADGVALHGNGEMPSSWTRIERCECGERACGNVGRQFSSNVPAAHAALLMEILGTLPCRGVLGNSPYTWQAPWNDDETDDEALQNADVVLQLHLQ
jgi:hypothetical protein